MPGTGDVDDAIGSVRRDANGAAVTRLDQVRDWRAWTIVLAGVIGAFLYSNFILDYILPGGASVFEVISVLETKGTPNADVLRTTDVIGGILMLVPLPYVWAAMPANGWRVVMVVSTAIFGIGSAISGIVPLPCDGATNGCNSTAEQLQQLTHDGASTLSQTGLFIGAIAVIVGLRHVGPQWIRTWGQITFWVGGVLGSILFLGAGTIDSTSWETGAAQRFQVLMSSVWVVCYSIYAAKDGLAARDRARQKETSA